MQCLKRLEENSKLLRKKPAVVYCKSVHYKDMNDSQQNVSPQEKIKLFLAEPAMIITSIALIVSRQHSLYLVRVTLN